jgi:hypothetical protein
MAGRWVFAFFSVLLISLGVLFFSIFSSAQGAGNLNAPLAGSCDSYYVNQVPVQYRQANGCPAPGFLQYNWNDPVPFTPEGNEVYYHCDPSLTDSDSCNWRTICGEWPVSSSNSCAWGGLPMSTDACATGSQCVNIEGECGCEVIGTGSGPNLAGPVPKTKIPDGHQFNLDETEGWIHFRADNINPSADLGSYTFEITGSSGGGDITNYMTNPPYLPNVNEYGINDFAGFWVTLDGARMITDGMIKPGIAYTLSTTFAGVPQQTGPATVNIENKESVAFLYDPQDPPGSAGTPAVPAPCACKSLTVRTVNDPIHNPLDSLPVPSISAGKNLGIPDNKLRHILDERKDVAGLGARLGIFEKVVNDNFILPVNPSGIKIKTAGATQSFEVSAEISGDPNGCLNGQIVKFVKHATFDENNDQSLGNEAQHNFISTPLNSVPDNPQPMPEELPENPDFSDPSNIPSYNSFTASASSSGTARFISDNFNKQLIPSSEGLNRLETVPSSDSSSTYIRRWIDTPGLFFSQFRMSTSSRSDEFRVRIVPDGPLLTPPKPSRKVASQINSLYLWNSPYPKLDKVVTSDDTLKQNSCECVFKRLEILDTPSALQYSSIGGTLSVGALEQLILESKYQSEMNLDVSKSTSNCVFDNNGVITRGTA